MRWRVVKGDVLVAGQPAIIFWFMGAEVIEDHVYFLVGVRIPEHIVHEVQKLPASAPLGVFDLHLASHHIERRKEDGRSVTFVFVRKARQRPAVRQTKVALRTLQYLDARLLVYGDHQRSVGRRKVQADNISSLGGKGRIR